MTTVETLARWATLFNCWHWPDDYPIPKPADFDALPHRDKSASRDKYRVAMPHVKAIRTIVPHKELMRDWHLFELGSTNEQFEAWYAEEYAESEPLIVE